MITLAPPQQGDDHDLRRLMEANAREQKGKTVYVVALEFLPFAQYGEGAASMASAQANPLAAASGQPRAGVLVNPGSVTIISPHHRSLELISGISGQGSTFLGSGLSVHITVETVTPAAEKYARSLGLYGALVLAKEMVRTMVPSMKALHVDRNEDPDEGGYPTIRFTITTRESIESVLEAESALQKALYQRLPARALMVFSFMYQFE